MYRANVQIDEFRLAPVCPGPCRDDAAIFREMQRRSHTTYADVETTFESMFNVTACRTECTDSKTDP